MAAPKAHLFLVALLQQLEVAPLLAVGAQRAVLVVRQAQRRGHAAALRVHPGVDVVGDIAPGDAAHRVHGEVQLLAAFQELEDKPKTREVNAHGGTGRPGSGLWSATASSFLESERSLLVAAARLE